MAEREIRIKVSAQDAGATSTINRLSKQMAELAAQGKDTKVLFSAEFHESQVEARMNEIIARMQHTADQHHIKIEADLVDREANQRLFGDRHSGLFPLAPVPLPSIADIEAAASLEYDAMLRFYQDAESAAKDGGRRTGEGFIDSLKAGFGGRSGLKDIIEIFRGAGPIAALALAAVSIGQVGEKAGALAEKLGAGELKAGGIAGELTKSLPIIGNVVRGADGLASALDGSAKRAGEMRKALEAAKQARGLVGDVEKGAESFSDRAKTAGLTGPALKAAQLEVDRAQMQREIEAMEAKVQEIAKLQNSLVTGPIGGREGVPQNLREQYDKLGQQAAYAQQQVDDAKRNAGNIAVKIFQANLAEDQKEVEQKKKQTQETEAMMKARRQLFDLEQEAGGDLLQAIVASAIAAEDQKKIDEQNNRKAAREAEQRERADAQDRSRSEFIYNQLTKDRGAPPSVQFSSLQELSDGQGLSMLLRDQATSGQAVLKDIKKLAEVQAKAATDAVGLLTRILTGGGTAVLE